MADDVYKYLRYPAPVLNGVNITLGPRSGRDDFVCDNGHGLLAYREGVMVGAIDVEVVEVDIVDVDSEWYDLWLWSDREDEGEREWERGEDWEEWYAS
jgi:hypothetical protein